MNHPRSKPIDLGMHGVDDDDEVNGGVGPPLDAQPDLASEIARLGVLRAQGLLTDAEFDAAKAKLLDL